MAGIVLSSPDVQEVFDLGDELARHDAPLRADRGRGLGAGAGADRADPRAAPGAAAGEGREGAPLQPALAEWIGQVRLPANLRLAVDIDPQSFL